MPWASAPVPPLPEPSAIAPAALAFDAPPMAMLFWPVAFAPTLRLVEPMAVEPDPLAVAA